MPANNAGYEDNPFVAEFYDPVYNALARRDTGFYVDMSVKSGGRTLELGCGTGRVLIPTAKAGCEITGLDSSQYMLAKCREKLTQEPSEVQARVELIRGDMTDFSIGKQFSLITIPFRPFQHLITVAEQKACLTCVRKHLADFGKFVFDVFQPFPPRLIDPKYLMEMETDPRVTLPDGSSMRRTNRVAAFHHLLAEPHLLLQRKRPPRPCQEMARERQWDE